MAGALAGRRTRLTGAQPGWLRLLADPEALAAVTAVVPAAGPGTMYFSGPSQNTATSAVTVNSPASHKNA